MTNSTATERRFSRRTARRLARLVCCLSAIIGLCLPCVSRAVVPMVRAIAPLAESEGAPVEESEPGSGENTEFEDLLRPEGRRLCHRPAPLSGELPLGTSSAPRRAPVFTDLCPATEHALRDG